MHTDTWQNTNTEKINTLQYYITVCYTVI